MITSAPSIADLRSLVARSTAANPPFSPSTSIARPRKPAILTLARRHGLTVYDASYLELAERSAAPLATLDVTLARAAQRENISLIGQET
jgi:predicted nucleic acid-binding protein